MALKFQKLALELGNLRAEKKLRVEFYSKGEILSLLGENGSGKTTLMNMLAGIYYPDAGQIIIDGKEPLSIPYLMMAFFIHSIVKTIYFLKDNSAILHVSKDVAP